MQINKQLMRKQDPKKNMRNATETKPKWSPNGTSSVIPNRETKNMLKVRRKMMPKQGPGIDKNRLNGVFGNRAFETYFSSLAL